MVVQLTGTDLARVCRDIAWSEISAMPGHCRTVGPRITATGQTVCWDKDNLYLDSLARMHLATAAATWCNAYDAGFEDLFLARRSSADWADVMVRARQSGASHFTFATSGSTGTRQFIRHREDVLAAEAEAWAQVLELLTRQVQGTPIRRVIVLAPTHHIYGFIWGVLLPLALDVQALDADIAALPPLLAGDLVVAVPDQWTWLSEAQLSPKFWPDSVYGVSSTAPLPKKTHDQLAFEPMSACERPALRCLLQIYGSSKTAGLAWRTDPAQPYTLAPGRARSGGDGKGDHNSGTDGISLQLPGGSWVDLAIQDQISWASATEFHLLSRSDHSVQVGGHNVSPQWVADQLMRHPAVKHASVRLNDNAEPARLKAFVVLNAPSSTQQRSELEAWAIEQLPWYATPAAIRYGTELPRNAIGKISNWPD